MSETGTGTRTAYAVIGDALEDVARDAVPGSTLALLVQGAETLNVRTRDAAGAWDDALQALWSVQGDAERGVTDGIVTDSRLWESWRTRETRARLTADRLRRRYLRVDADLSRALDAVSDEAARLGL